MFSFKLLGGVSLEGTAGPLTGRVMQRRQLSVLVLLALARGRPVSRERIVGVLWPDDEADRGRRLLSDSVYLIRKALGDEAVVASGDALRLDPQVVSSDLGAFEAALENADPAGAAALYSGPLLDGVYLADTPEWERLVDAERERVARLYAGALEALAASARMRRDFAAEVEWWRQRAAQDPYNSRVALRLMESLHASGDLAGALRHAEVFQRLRREELGLDGDSEVAALAEHLPDRPLPAGTEWDRAPPPPPPVLAGGERDPDPAGVSAPGFEQGADEPRESVLETAPSHPARRPGGRSYALGRRYALWAIVLLLASAGALAGIRRWSADAPDGVPARIAILPFAVRGGDDIDYLGEGLVDLLSVSLDDIDGLRSVDPRALLYFARSRPGQTGAPGPARAVAGRFDAELFVLGSVAQAGGRLRMSASLYGKTQEPMGTVAVDGPADSLFTLVDRLAAQIVGLRFGAPGERLNRLAARTTGSLAALRSYLQAERRFRAGAGRDPEVLPLLRQAVAQDSTFALAHYRLSVAASWGSQTQLMLQAGERAYALRERLAPRERVLVEAWAARLRGRVDEAERGYRAVLQQYPDDAEAWWQLAELLLQVNPQRGRPITEARAGYQQALRLDPSLGCARCSLLFIELSERELGAAASLAAGFPTPVEQRGLRAVQAVAANDTAAMERLLRELRGADAWSIHEAHFRTLQWGGNEDYSRRVGTLLTEVSRPPEWRGIGLVGIAYGEMAAGRSAAARAVLDTLAVVEPAWALQLRALFVLVPGHTAPADELSRVRDEIAAWNPDRSPASSGYFTSSHNQMQGLIRSYLLGVLSVALGDDAGVAGSVRSLEREGNRTDNAALGQWLALGVRARHAARKADAGAALALLEEREAHVPAAHLWYSPFLAAPLERYFRAELLLQSGRPREALQWYETLGAAPIWDLPFVPLASLRQGEIHERLGRRSEARRHYARVLALWPRVDPPLQPQVATARERLAALARHPE